MNKLLAIFDSDVLYASRLMEYLKRLDWEDFEVILFTRQESLQEFLEYETVEILLFGGDSIPQDLSKHNVKYVFNLSQDQKMTKGDDQLIYKYQSAAKISSDIISAYTRLEDSVQSTTYGNVQIISIYSPVPGYEKLSFAWLLAKELSNIKKTLFIPLDLLPTDLAMQVGENEQSLSEFLYYLKETKTDYSGKLKSYLNYSEKLSYLSGLTHGFDLLSISGEDMGRFIEALLDNKDYEEVIFFLGIYTEASMEILSRSNIICIARTDQPYEELATREWERQMELTGFKLQNLRHHTIRLPISNDARSINSIQEHITSDIRPISKDFAEILLKKSQSKIDDEIQGEGRHELVKRKTSTRGA